MRENCMFFTLNFVTIKPELIFFFVLPKRFKCVKIEHFLRKFHSINVQLIKIPLLLKFQLMLFLYFQKRFKCVQIAHYSAKFHCN